MEIRPGRIVGILVGTVVILGLGVYGPVTLLAPLPAVQASVVDALDPAAAAAPPVLPADGASAVVVSGSSTAVATAGITDPVPIAGVAKAIEALVVIDAKPVAVGNTGPTLTISNEDYADYIDYSKADARAIPVFLGETWTEREVLQAVLLGSSNNHADTLARWAFGSVDAYTTAAATWLTAHGLTGTHISDATGLSGYTVGTATDAARVADLVMSQPTLAEILSNPATSLVNNRGVDNTTNEYADLGVFGISRSFSDPAGVCFLFTTTVGTGETSTTIAGAFLREPDYDTLPTDLKAFVTGAQTGAAPVAVVAKGASHAHFRAAWGAEANGVAGADITRSAWQIGSAGAKVDLDAFSTGLEGGLVGHVGIAGGPQIPLKLDRAIKDPGLGWRLMHPFAMISSLIAANR